MLDTNPPTATSTTNTDPTTTTMTNREKMLAGLPYDAMTDPELRRARLRVRRLFQAYNNYPWPDPADPSAEYFGPEERMQLLADIFGMTVREIRERPIEIEPPCYFDYVRLSLIDDMCSRRAQSRSTIHGWRV